MKKLILPLFVLGLFFAGCSKDEDIDDKERVEIPVEDPISNPVEDPVGIDSVL